MEFDNLKNLSNQAMVAVAKGWVEPGEAHTAISGIKEVAGYLDLMTDAHQGLLRLQLTPVTSPEVNAMVEQGLALDSRHDRFVRGIDLVAAGNALLLEPENPVVADLASLRVRLLPQGLGIIHATYLEEAGEADMVKERLRPEDRALLGKVPTMSGNLSDAVDQWVETGNALGALERERARVAEAMPSSDTVKRADVLKARNQWIRVVRAILTGLDLVEGLDEKTRTLILQPLKTAVGKAAQKAGAKGEAEEEAEEEATEEAAQEASEATS